MFDAFQILRIYFTIEDTIARLFPSSDQPAPAPSTPRDLRQERTAVDFLLREFSTRSHIPATCVVFLFDSDRYTLCSDTDGPTPTQDPPQLRQYFAQVATANGYCFVDLGLLFAEEFKRNPRRLDFSPLDPDWNRNGHRVAARAAMAALQAVDAAGSQCQL